MGKSQRHDRHEPDEDDDGVNSGIPGELYSGDYGSREDHRRSGKHTRKDAGGDPDVTGEQAPPPTDGEYNRPEEGAYQPPRRRKTRT